jgi:hypothetical protein
VLATRKRDQTGAGTFIRCFYDIAVHINPPLVAGLLGAAAPEYIELCGTFVRSISSWIAKSFALPGSVAGLTEEQYADMIVVLFKQECQGVAAEPTQNAEHTHA